ncbi:hypothetical protein PVK06_047947 [Gossypium arboreum]|uniref:Uncharacterized protein n=1 Tax=Gossypium arboreum TaxID=29729 RepID=A0ABR0MGK5_GOSAR|nr:hypothetical protein PVK06_047947 [Gossypium arboreum]
MTKLTWFSRRSEEIGAVDNEGIEERNVVVWVREIGVGGREEAEITRSLREGIKGEGLLVVVVMMVVPNEVVFWVVKVKESHRRHDFF